MQKCKQTYMCTHANVHTCRHAHISHSCSNINACTYIYIETYMHTCKHMLAHTLMQARIRTCVQASCIRTGIHTLTYTHLVYINTYICTHMHNASKHSCVHVHVHADNHARIQFINFVIHAHNHAYTHDCVYAHNACTHSHNTCPILHQLNKDTGQDPSDEEDRQGESDYNVGGGGEGKWSQNHSIVPLLYSPMCIYIYIYIYKTYITPAHAATPHHDKGLDQSDEEDRQGELCL